MELYPHYPQHDYNKKYTLHFRVWPEVLRSLILIIRSLPGEKVQKHLNFATY